MSQQDFVTTFGFVVFLAILSAYAVSLYFDIQEARDVRNDRDQGPH